MQPNWAFSRELFGRPKTAALFRVKEKKARSLREEIEELGALFDAIVNESGEPLKKENRS